MVKQQIGKEEMAKVVGAELHLMPVRCLPRRAIHYPRVVDQSVKLFVGKLELMSAVEALVAAVVMVVEMVVGGVNDGNTPCSAVVE